jgi:hypothetical protein
MKIREWEEELKKRKGRRRDKGGTDGSERA